MLIATKGQARLAPLYDVASTLPYEFDSRRLKMATKIGGKYLLEAVYPHHWSKFASEVRLPSAEVLDMGRSMVETVPSAFAAIVEVARTQGLDHPILQRMFQVLKARSEHCSRVLAASTS